MCVVVHTRDVCVQELAHTAPDCESLSWEGEDPVGRAVEVCEAGLQIRTDTGQVAHVCTVPVCVDRNTAEGHRFVNLIGFN